MVKLIGWLLGRAAWLLFAAICCIAPRSWFDGSPWECRYDHWADGR